jgi:NADH dehydrogenase
MAGQIAELAHESLRWNFRRIDPATARILLLDGAPRLLGGFSEQLADRATQRLEQLGVEVRLGAMVTGVDADGVDVETDSGTERVQASTKIWTAGVQASPLGALLADRSGAELTRSGQVRVGWRATRRRAGSTTSIWACWPRCPGTSRSANADGSGYRASQAGSSGS